MKSRPVYKAIPLRVTPVAAAVASALGTISGASLANDTEEIVVTATRRDATIQEVPYSISAISGDQIEALQIQDLSGIARYTPGLIQIDQGARDANQLVIRGINASPINAPELLRNTQGDRVSTYFGETPVYIDLKPIDLERVEILRGPQGTLYGTRSMGGTIRYVPKAPELDAMTVDTHGRVYTMDESDDLGYDGDIVANLPLIENTLALRAMYGYSDQPGFIDQPYLVREAGVSCPEPFYSDAGCKDNDLRSKDDTNDVKTTSARLSLLWQVSDDFDATLNWNYQDQDIGGRQINTRESMRVINTPSGGSLELDKYDNGLRFLEENDRTNNIYNLELNYSTSNFDVLSSTSYTTYKDRGNRDQTDLLLLYGYGAFPAFSAYTIDRTDDDIFTQEIRFVSNDTESKWDWIGGVFYQDTNLDQESREFAPGFAFNPSGEVTFISANRNAQEYALFGEIGYQFTDKLHGLVGGRWFDIDDDLESCIQFTDFEDTPSCDKGDGDDDDTLWKASVDYQFTNDLLGYALFSQGSSPGGINPDSTGSLTDSEKFVDPEKIDNYEIGVKSTWLDNRLTINASVYYMDWDDIQFESISENMLQITTNGSGAESTGLELESVFALNENWTLSAGYSYTKAELTDGCETASDFQNKSCPLPETDLLGNPGITKDGDRLPGTPEHQGTLQVNYFRPINSGMDFNASWRMATQSDVFTRLGDGDDCCRAFGDELGGFSVHYATLGVSTEKWDATLYADNLFNKYAETGVRNDASFIGTDTELLNKGYGFDLIGAGGGGFAERRYFKNVITPRVVGIDFRYRFRGE